MRATRSIADEAAGDFPDSGAEAEQEALLASFLKSRGITQNLTAAQKIQLLTMVQRGFKAYLDVAPNQFRKRVDLFWHCVLCPVFSKTDSFLGNSSGIFSLIFSPKQMHP